MFQKFTKSLKELEFNTNENNIGEIICQWIWPTQKVGPDLYYNTPLIHSFRKSNNCLHSRVQKKCSRHKRFIVLSCVDPFSNPGFLSLTHCLCVVVALSELIYDKYNNFCPIPSPGTVTLSYDIYIHMFKIFRLTILIFP